MTATETPLFDGELPLLVSCLTCCSTYVVPNGPPALERFNAERAASWFSEHPCVLFGESA